MFHSLRYIRVLDLSSSLLYELPSFIKVLKPLRYLDLSRIDIKELPNSICNLCNLQTLKLLGCLWLFELPKDLGNMVNLHYFELDEIFWFKCRTLPLRMGNLTCLQNLHTFPVNFTSGHGIEELKDMANLTGTLHILNLKNAMNAAEAKLNKKESHQKLVLEWSEKDFNQEYEVRAKRGLKDLQPHSNLKELALDHFKGSNFPSWMTDDRLHISNYPKLREVPKLMPNLRVLKIKKCDSLKALPMAASLMFLILIDSLVLEDWQEGICITEDDQGN
ncbi:hypothetical protein CRYUN_Cryun16bG0044000 [Craigia yunnanensis]